MCVCVCVLQVRAKLAMLHKQWPVAENLLLSQGKVDECIAMYQNIHKYVLSVQHGCQAKFVH